MPRSTTAAFARVLRRTALTGVVLILLAALSSCAAYRAAGPSDPKILASEAPARPIQVAGYTTADRRFHAFDGRVRLAGDSLVFERRQTTGIGITAEPPQRVVTMARDQVASVTIADGKDVSVTVGVSVVALFFGALLVLGLVYAGVGNF